MRKEKAELFIMIGFLLFLAGTITLVRPFVKRAYGEIRTLKSIESIILPSGWEDEIAAVKEAADEYNKSVAFWQAVSGFMYTEKYEDPAYDSLLCGPDGIMCLLEIPKIRIIIPVGHGTSAELLAHSAGHLYGTSLPTGGTSVHSVIAAHAGLPDRKLFTDLPSLDIGDEFHIYVLGEKHTYTVDHIIEVIPSETEELSVIGGEDHITLMTCVPYGINTRRLFVRGIRTDTKEHERADDLVEKSKVRLFLMQLRIAAFLMLPIAEILVFFIYKIYKNDGGRNDED